MLIFIERSKSHDLHPQSKQPSFHLSLINGGYGFCWHDVTPSRKWQFWRIGSQMKIGFFWFLIWFTLIKQHILVDKLFSWYIYFSSYCDYCQNYIFQFEFEFTLSSIYQLSNCFHGKSILMQLLLLSEFTFFNIYLQNLNLRVLIVRCCTYCLTYLWLKNQSIRFQVKKTFRAYW